MKFESAVPATAIEYGGVPCPCFPESKVSRGLRERQRERDGATYKDEERRLAAGQGRCEYKRSIHGRLSAHPSRPARVHRACEGSREGKSWAIECRLDRLDSTRIINGECISRRELGGGTRGWCVFHAQPSLQFLR